MEPFSRVICPSEMCLTFSSSDGKILKKTSTKFVFQQQSCGALRIFKGVRTPTFSSIIYLPSLNLCALFSVMFRLQADVCN